MKSNWRDHPKSDELAKGYYALYYFVKTLHRLGLLTDKQEAEMVEYYWSTSCPY